MAYVPQQAWIQHDTVRGNILFGKDMEQVLYERCLHACALGPDLHILPGADLTEIGEKVKRREGGREERGSWGEGSGRAGGGKRAKSVR